MFKATQIYLAPLKKEDASLLFNWINDRELVTFNAPYKPVSDLNHEVWYKQINKHPTTTIFAIRLLADKALAGSCQLFNIHSIARSAELQIRIGEKAHRDRGYGTEALNLLVQFGFKDLNLNRIYLHVFAKNIRAQKVYQKVGFVPEGLLRKAAFIDGEYQDVMIMGLLRSEYEDNF